MDARRVSAFFLLCVALLALPAAAQPLPDPADQRMAEELSAIRRALERLVALEESGARQRDVDLLFRRIELRERRLAPFERQVRDAEEDVRETERRIDQLDRMHEQLDGRLEQEIRGGTDAPDSDTRRKTEDVEKSQVAAAERLKDVRGRLAQLELDLARRRVDVETLDEMLEERIEDLHR